MLPKVVPEVDPSETLGVLGDRRIGPHTEVWPSLLVGVGESLEEFVVEIGICACDQ
jgi:hypothetical protein